jgi:hypothetical protein
MVFALMSILTVYFLWIDLGWQSPEVAIKNNNSSRAHDGMPPGGRFRFLPTSRGQHFRLKTDGFLTCFESGPWSFFVGFFFITPMILHE